MKSDDSFLSDIPAVGFTGTTLVDYPGHMASIIFLGGCDLRCPYCHNHTIFSIKKEMLIDPEELIQQMEKRKNFTEALCITGGEPLLYNTLYPFIKYIRKKFSIKIKVDTNGLHPELLKKLLPLLDYVAVDIKAPPNDYEKLETPYDDTVKRIEKTRDFLEHSACITEYRTTVYPPIISDASVLRKMEPFVPEKASWTLQQFNPQNAFSAEAKKTETYKINELEKLCRQLQKNFPEREILLRTSQ
ncbi:MAG: anaerobic ribonucleoside-triphosphate reductase activating protein [bacterium]